MRTITGSNQAINSNWRKVSAWLLVSILILLSLSCQKNEENLSKKSAQTALLSSSPASSKDSSISQMSFVFGHKVFTRTTGAPVVATSKISNPRFDCFDGNFILKIQNGDDKKTRVASAEINIDGVQVVGPSDFSKNVTSITKTLTGLTSESVLEIKLNSTPGAFIDLWIEGTIILHIPTFDQIGPLCQNSTAPLLPLSSTNPTSIKGKWNPATINTAILGKTKYSFTPDEDQCGTPTFMEIEVIPPVTPTFTQIGPLLQNSVPPLLPATSINGIPGTWNPSTINTTVADTITFTFTPNAGQCSNKTTMDIIVTNKGSVTDIDGKVYGTILIGEQWWMAENLKTAKYKNGDLIGTTTTSGSDISGESTPKYQWAYNGEETNVPGYGRLYTWYAVTDSRGVCPTGWHVPTDAEWTTFENYLTTNGFGYEGSGPDIAKSIASKSGWTANATAGNVGNDQPGNNKSGFSALPNGDRKSSGTFELLGTAAAFWSFSENNTANGWSRGLSNDQNSLNRSNTGKAFGMAVRCTKDK